MWFFKLIESFFKRERGEQGSGLMTVLGVSLVVTIAAGTITSSIVMASNLTYNKLSGQQADEAAEAGIVAAVNDYQSGNCKNFFENTTLKYKYNVYRSTAAEAPTSTSGSGTYAGCPGSNGEGQGSAADRWLVIKSIGRGTKEKILKTKLAIYKLNPENESVVPQAITAARLDLRSGFVLNKASGVNGQTDVYIKDSNYNTSIYSWFKCASSATINANVKYNSDDSFNYEKNNLDASYVQDCAINGNLKIKDKSNASSNLNLKNIEVKGDVCSTDNLISKTDASKVSGKLYKSVDCLTDEEGTRFGYVPDMSNAVKATTESCESTTELIKQILTVSKLNNGENNILDLTECSNATLKSIWYGTDVKNIVIDGDITLVYKQSFRMRSTNITALGDNQSFNLVVPSGVAKSDDSSYVTGMETSYIYNVKLDPSVSSFMYTPHSLYHAYSVINGQVYAGAQFYNGATTTLNYMPVGLPDAEVKIKDIGKAKDLIRVY